MKRLPVVWVRPCKCYVGSQVKLWDPARSVWAWSVLRMTFSSCHVHLFCSKSVKIIVIASFYLLKFLSCGSHLKIGWCQRLIDSMIAFWKCHQNISTGSWDLLNTGELKHTDTGKNMIVLAFSVQYLYMKYPFFAHADTKSVQKRKILPTHFFYVKNTHTDS